jgi:hypothetical protein
MSPLFTVADSQALRGEIAGGHTKNLFLKDKKDNYFLMTVEEDADGGPEAPCTMSSARRAAFPSASRRS